MKPQCPPTPRRNPLAPEQHAELAAILERRGIPVSEIDRVHNREPNPRRPMIQIWSEDRPDIALVRCASDPVSDQWHLSQWTTDSDVNDWKGRYFTGTLMEATAQAIADTSDGKRKPLPPEQHAELTALLNERSVPLSEMKRVHSRGADPQNPVFHIWHNDYRDIARVVPGSDPPDDSWLIIGSWRITRWNKDDVATKDMQVTIHTGTLMEAVAQAVADTMPASV